MTDDVVKLYARTRVSETFFFNISTGEHAYEIY